uniref:Protein kinase domain-containing protein n=1 Tax=Bionectria ochroleuca TaxID=29856 RepID=A0A0B7K1R9_BIOOC
MPVLDRKSGTLFAAKEPYYKSNDDPATRKSLWEAIENEFRLLERLDHPHIVSAVEFVGSRHREELDEPPWLTMEYIPQTLVITRLSEQAAVIIASQSFCALASLHANHIVHLNISRESHQQHQKGHQAKTSDQEEMHY